MEDENFNQELEDFFRLFKRLIEKESDQGTIPGVDPAQMEQLKAFMAQFDDVKDDLKGELHKVDPFTKMMISSIVKQLREQLGPEADEVGPPTVEDIVSRREEELSDVTDADVRARALIATIDDQLKNPHLSEEEIDVLLDKRSQISAKLSGD
ncbi:MAG: hypothetical protein J6X40_02310 [Bacteroidales bacterium]|nr:hypothetical protein [Bacteroidales bacterium]